jgi:hypothetical protein
MSRPPSIDTLRKKIAALQAEKAELSTQRRSRQEVTILLEAMIAQSFAAGEAQLQRELGKAALGEPFTPVLLTVPTLVALLGIDTVKAAFCAPLASVPVGLPSAERIARLEAINADLDQLETQEESICESEGIERRPTARPEIILCCTATN